jgi:hypothetical protein
MIFAGSPDFIAMNFLEILLGGIIGTTIMTGFSYYVSRVRKKQFREPELLNELLVRGRLMKFTTSKNHPAGWLIHYLVGILFVAAYQLTSHITSIEADFAFYTLSGLISGFAGAAIWHVTLMLHPNPPAVAVKEFYLQLVLAHVIFGMTAYPGLLIFR